MRGGGGWNREVMSLQSRGRVWRAGNTEERNLLRGPLPLMECAADAKAP